MSDEEAWNALTAEAETQREALEFVREFLNPEGSGRGWTASQADTVVALALGTATTSEQRMVAQGVMGVEWVAKADGR